MDEIPSISSLHAEKNIKENSKKDIFTIVLNKCIEKIVFTNRHTDKTFVIFEVPKILIGYPNYDMKSCIFFLLTKLEKHGYYMELIEPFYLYIDWGSLRETKKLQKNSKKVIFQKKNFSPEIEFIYEDIINKASKKKKKKK
jgi:hypothetical protein